MDLSDAGPPPKIRRVQDADEQDNATKMAVKCIKNFQEEQHQQQSQGLMENYEDHRHQQRRDQQVQEEQQLQGPPQEYIAPIAQVLEPLYAQAQEIQQAAPSQELPRVSSPKLSQAFSSLQPQELFHAQPQECVHTHRAKEQQMEQPDLSNQKYKSLFRIHRVQLALRRLVIKHRQRIIKVQQKIISNEIEKIAVLNQNIQLYSQSHRSIDAQLRELRLDDYEKLSALQYQLQNRIQRVRELEDEHDSDLVHLHEFLGILRGDFNIQNFMEKLSDSNDDSVDKEKSDDEIQAENVLEPELLIGEGEDSQHQPEQEENRETPELMHEEHSKGSIDDNRSLPELERPRVNQIIEDNSNLHLQDERVQE